MALTKRRFTREFKLAAVEEMESGKAVARLARELEIHENVLWRWRQEFHQDPRGAFGGKGQKRTNNREAELERKIGQMALEIDFLKKALARVQEQRLMEMADGVKRSSRRLKKK